LEADVSDINTYFQVHAQEFEKDLCTLLSIPSVSTDAERKPDMQACAQEVVRQLLQAGMVEARIMPTGGHPAVFAASKHRAGLPTILVYGHYDVQPETPLELWESPPFQPTVRDGKIYARGTTDDKGQFLIHLKAAQGLHAVHGQLPVNLKFILEGEEEIGSPNLPAFIEEHKELLACDVLVISDTGMYAPGIPSLLYGLRGLSYLEVEVKGADGDLHSGIFGGGVPNPALELCRILTALKGSDGRILVPGFYDKVRDLSPAEREEWAALPFDEEEFRNSVGCKGLSGEEGFTTLERRWARPTLDVNGMLSGFTGEGVKTVLPGRAMAKVSCRLVPDQDPEEIARLVEQEILRLAPDTVEVKVHPERYGSFRQRLYDEWIRTNQAQVDAKGGGRIAYVHMKDMGGQSLEQFYIEMTSEAFQRDALILDLRFNTGGNVHDDILRFLTQRPYTQWKYRGGKLAPQPNFAPAARPIVLLINEQSLSDAEMTAAGFKALKLGPVIGTETYRWLIFTSGRALVDGSYFRLPSWGCYTLDGQDIERHGVAPDIYVQTTVKDRLDGRDPQLDRAIAEILSVLK
jgi:acetylornithine deacetylase/succinyl-diaminopimelate desuccinylase-like protein